MWSKAIHSTSIRQKPESPFLYQLNFPTLLVDFQLHQSLSNFSCIFQLQSEYSNFGANFSTAFFPISCRTSQLLVFPNCPFQLQVSPRIPRMGNRTLKPGQFFEHDFFKPWRGHGHEFFSKNVAWTWTWTRCETGVHRTLMQRKNNENI